MLKKLAGAFVVCAALTVATPIEGQPSSPAEVEKEDFFKEQLAPVRKDKGYDLTIVYFMDYQCPACRQYSPDVTKALSEDRKLRVIYRDTPLLGPRSDAAARAAIASQFQGKHEAFHKALMAAELPLDEGAIKAAAAKAGLDWNRLQSDIAKRADEIDRQILTNMMLSTATGISGTPAFIIGNRLSNGALEYKDLKAEIADARRELAVPDVAEPSRANDAVTEEVQENPKPQREKIDNTSEGNALFEQTSSSPTAEDPDPLTEGPAGSWVMAAVVAGLVVGLLSFLVLRRRSSRPGPDGAF